MNIQDILDSLGIDYKAHGEHHHTTVGRIQTDCPRCTPDHKHYRLGWNLANGYASCWSCGHISIHWALYQLSGLHYEVINNLLRDITPNSKLDHAIGRLEIPKGVGPLLKPHIDYIKSRGFDPTEVQRVWGVQGIGMTARLPWRLFIPISHNGKTVSWTTRSISNETEMRYIAAGAEQESMSRQDLLYGQEHARHAVVCCEGPIDVWRIGHGAVATLGTSYSKGQVNKLSRYLKRIIVFDAEDNAQRRARELCHELEAFSGKTMNVVLETGKDPAEAKQREINQIRRLLK
jgi:hypothetical protein